MYMDFETAAQKVKTLNTRPDDYTLGRLYGLYKQATVGDCNIPQPWAVQLEARAKWDAWNSQKGKSSDKAKKEYVRLVERLLEKNN